MRSPWLTASGRGGGTENLASNSNWLGRAPASPLREDPASRPDHHLFVPQPHALPRYIQTSRPPTRTRHDTTRRWRSPAAVVFRDRRGCAPAAPFHGSYRGNRAHSPPWAICLLMDPAARRLPGQLFERAAALAFPEDRDHGGGQERARYGNQQDPAQRRGRGEDHSAEQDAAPGTEVAHAVGPAGAQRAHPGRVVAGYVHPHAELPQRDADRRHDKEGDQSRGVVGSVDALPAAGEHDGTRELGVFSLDPLAE